MIKIYLSPSRQSYNTYAVGNTTEKEQMEALANIINNILKNEYDCESVIATSSLNIDINGRTEEAKAMGCSVYLALHSNSGGEGKASGAIAFYHPNNIESFNLATNIVKELNAICPIKSNRYEAVINGMTAFNNYGYGEIRAPAEKGLTPVLAETDFHDNPQTAQWIIDNKDLIAKAYVKAITETFNIKKKDVPVPQTESKYYRVQIGAFINKENAEALVDKLKAAGFDAIIKYM
jgi:N-acetylmuramoyl-L-alanine amidase